MATFKTVLSLTFTVPGTALNLKSDKYKSEN